MVIIETNVVSELMRPTPAVLTWFSRQRSANLYPTAVSEAELRAGAAILPAGQRRDRLAAEVDAVVREDFAGALRPRRCQGLCGDHCFALLPGPPVRGTRWWPPATAPISRIAGLPLSTLGRKPGDERAMEAGRGPDEASIARLLHSCRRLGFRSFQDV